MYNPTPSTSYSFYNDNVLRNPLWQNDEIEIAPPPYTFQITTFFENTGDAAAAGEDAGIFGLWDFDQEQPSSSSSLDMMDDIMLQPHLFSRRRSHYVPRRVVQRVLANNMEAVRNDTMPMSEIMTSADVYRYIENMHVHEMANIMTQFMEEEIMNELGDLLLEDTMIDNIMFDNGGSERPIITKEDMELLYPACKQAAATVKWCTVCHENIGLEDKVRVLDCKHVYHVDCIDEWCGINATCPVCRGDITKSTI